MAQFRILSPDGFDIEMNKTYRSENGIKKALKNFRKRYEHQGFYSSRGTRIHLDDLAEECSVVEIKK